MGCFQALTLHALKWQMHIQEKDEIVHQVLFACMTLRKLCLSFVSMNQSEGMILISEGKKIFLI